MVFFSSQYCNGGDLADYLQGKLLLICVPDTQIIMDQNKVRDAALEGKLHV